MPSSSRRASSASLIAKPGRQKTYSGADLLQIGMPMGGIGAGCVCLNGYGGLQDFSIRNLPANSAMPDGHGVTDSAFAVLHIKGSKPVTRLLEGPLPPEKIYDQGLKAQGFRESGHEGLPRFSAASFHAEYPFGYVTLSHPEVPLGVTITGWSPFIPLDEVNSGIPCAILEYSFTNKTARPVTFQFSFNASNFADPKNGENVPLGDVGVFFTSKAQPLSGEFGSAAIAAVGHAPSIKAAWFRGGWFDGISALWKELEAGQFKPNAGNTGLAHGTTGRAGGSIMVEATVAPRKSLSIPVVLAWHFPNVHYSEGTIGAAGTCTPKSDDSTPKKPLWRPFYASQWHNAHEVALFVTKHLDTLRARTLAFKNALFSSTLPPFVIDAVASNLAILKSPTVLRQENGDLYLWEGCFTGCGCCYGSCTHVWNYAQALPHLYPKLERTLRDAELVRSMDDRGHVTFRSALPAGPTGHGDRQAAADGQLGGIMKVLRDYSISGDRSWLAKIYPLVKRSIDYCINLWDPKREGVVREPHHNTYDIEFWGAEPMCTTIYAGALEAMAVMARVLDKPEEAKPYSELAHKAGIYCAKHLFNGEYFEQKVQWTGLADTSMERRISAPGAEHDEEVRLIKKEGPKYQYGRGCLSDGVIGAWMASLYGIAAPLEANLVRKHLRSIFKYNFKTSLVDHVCLQRPGYAMGDEGGLLLCSWPLGNKPTLPFVYSDEVWTGIEYQVASHMILEGLVNEGLTIVKQLRERYDGHVRNPFNEYECGSYYGRALASYALLASLSGFRYSAAEKTLWFGPKIKTPQFSTFFSAATGFGTISLAKRSLDITMVEGHLALKKVVLTIDGKIRTLEIDEEAAAGFPLRIGF